MSADPRGVVDGGNPTGARRYGFQMTRNEVGLAIDGVTKLVDPTHQEAAPLLHRLQALYALTKDLEPKEVPRG